MLWSDKMWAVAAGLRQPICGEQADAALKKAREEVKGEEETVGENRGSLLLAFLMQLQRKLREAELEMRRYAEQVSAIPKLKAQVFEMGAKMKVGE